MYFCICSYICSRNFLYVYVFSYISVCNPIALAGQSGKPNILRQGPAQQHYGSAMDTAMALPWSCHGPAIALHGSATAAPWQCHDSAMGRAMQYGTAVAVRHVLTGGLPYGGYRKYMIICYFVLGGLRPPRPLQMPVHQVLCCVKKQANLEVDAAARYTATPSNCVFNSACSGESCKFTGLGLCFFHGLYLCVNQCKQLMSCCP